MHANIIRNVLHATIVALCALSVAVADAAHVKVRAQIKQPEKGHVFILQPGTEFADAKIRMRGASFSGVSLDLYRTHLFGMWQTKVPRAPTDFSTPVTGWLGSALNLVKTRIPGCLGFKYVTVPFSIRGVEDGSYILKAELKGRVIGKSAQFTILNSGIPVGTDPDFAVVENVQISAGNLIVRHDDGSGGRFVTCRIIRTGDLREVETYRFWLQSGIKSYQVPPLRFGTDHYVECSTRPKRYLFLNKVVIYRTTLFLPEKHGIEAAEEDEEEEESDSDEDSGDEEEEDGEAEHGWFVGLASDGDPADGDGSEGDADDECYDD